MTDVAKTPVLVEVVGQEQFAVDTSKEESFFTTHSRHSRAQDPLVENGTSAPDVFFLFRIVEKLKIQIQNLSRVWGGGDGGGVLEGGIFLADSPAEQDSLRLSSQPQPQS